MMNFGITIPLIAAALPEPFCVNTLEDINYGTLSVRTPGGLDRLKKHLIYLHEMAHFTDIFSTPIGCFIFLLDNARIFQTLNLFKLINQYPISFPIELPLSTYILKLKVVEQKVRYVAKDAERLRNAVDLLKLIYYGDTEPFGLRLQIFNNGIIDKPASIIPVFNRHFFYPDLSNECGDIYTKNFPIDTNDIIEALALFTECNWIDSCSVPGNRSERDMLLRLFPRKATSSWLFTHISHLDSLKRSTYHRFVLWKSLLGPLCIPNVFDHQVERIKFSVQHPVLRLKRMLRVLSGNDIQLPHFNTFFENADYLVEFDKVLSHKANLETINDLKKSFCSSQGDKVWLSYNKGEDLVAKDIQPYYNHLNKMFYSIWNNIDDFIYYNILGFQFAHGNRFDSWNKEITPLVSITPNELSAIGNSNDEIEKNILMLLNRFLALDLDSDRHLGLFERYAAGLFPLSKSRESAEDKLLQVKNIYNFKNVYCEALSGYKVKDIDWKNRLTIPIKEKFAEFWG